MSEYAPAPPPGEGGPPPLPLDAGVADEGGPNRTLLIVLGVVVGLVALFGLYTFVLSPLLGGDEEITQLPTPVPGSGEAELPDGGEFDADGNPIIDGDAADGSGGRGTPVPETFEIFSSRDPFQQLVIERPATGVDEPSVDEGDDADADAGADGSADGVDPVVVVPPSDDAGDLSGEGPDDPSDEATPSADVNAVSGQGTQGQGGQGQGPQPQSSQAQAPEYWERPGAGTIEVTFVATTVTTAGADAVVMNIDGTEYEVVEGEIFAERFWLLDIHDQCGTFLFGDSRFTLCAGETIMK